jgi:hypothetical protein
MADDGLRAPRPGNVTIDQEADALRLAYRWFSAKYVFMAFFCVAWDGFLVFWYGIALSQKVGLGNFMIWFPIAHVAVGIGITYSTLAGFVNRTVVRVSSSAVTVRHGPLPWLGQKSVAASDIGQVYRQQLISTSSRGGSSVSYQLSVATHDQRKIDLLKCDSSDTALYIEQEVERYLGIGDRPVAGEMPK